MLTLVGCPDSDNTVPETDNSPAPSADPLADAPEQWPAFIAWAAKQLATAPDPIPPPEAALAEPRWPVIRLGDRLGSTTIQSEWQPRSGEAEALVRLGPFRTDWPHPDLAVQQRAEGFQAGVQMLLRGFQVQREKVGQITIDIRVPQGEHFDLRWSRAGKIRVPVPDTERFWKLNIATDGFAEWSGPLDRIAIQTFGTGDEPVEIRSLQFLPHAETYPEAAAARRVKIGSRLRDAVYLHCPGRITWHALDLPDQARLTFGLAAVGEVDGTAATLKVSLSAMKNGQKQLVWSGTVAMGEGWKEQSLSLDDWAGTTSSLVLEASTDAPGAVLCVGSPTIYRPVDQPPRVMIYLIDALSAEHIGFYGYQRPTMPHLESLAKEGVWFANAFANSPRTVESVADMLLSLPTESHGVFHSSATAASELVTLTEVLRAAGFATACFSTNVNAGPRQNVDQGFDDYYDRIAYWWSGHADRTVPIKDVLDWMRDHQDRPAFVYIHTAEPHAPYTPPPDYAGRFDSDYSGSIDGTHDRKTGFRTSKTARDLAHAIALYDEEILYADARLAAFLEALRGAGLSNQLTLFVTADHGEEFQQHFAWEHGDDLHNELMRIPLVVTGSSVQVRGRQGTPAQLYDLMPTILDLQGLPDPYGLAGKSLRSVLQEKEPAAVLRERDIVASNLAFVPRGIRQYALVEGGRWKLMHNFPRGRGALAERFEPFGLFDLDSDPDEKKNVIDVNRDRARRLIGELITWHKEHAPISAKSPADTLILDADQLEELRSLGYIE